MHPINDTLLTVLDNQISRTRMALADLPDATLDIEPGGDCNTIRGIGRHLILLRRFQLRLLESPRAADVPEDPSFESVDELIRLLDEYTSLLRQAIIEHDPDDWNRVPDTPREGPWGDDPTLTRIIRPLNDFTNHLGGIRVIRRANGHPAAATQ